MNRFIATIWTDVRLQARNGFYYAAAVVAVVIVVLLRQVPGLDLAWLIPGLVLGNLAINTYYFIAALVLLEKAEGSLLAQAVTPLRPIEYLGSKVVSLVLLSLLENGFIAVLLYGPGFQLIPFALGLTLASAVFALVGFLVVARYDSINAYLLPSVLPLSLIELPLLAYFARWEHPVVYLHPLQAGLVLLQGAFQPLDPAYWIYGMVYGSLVFALLLVFTSRTFSRFAVTMSGAD